MLDAQHTFSFEDANTGETPTHHTLTPLAASTHQIVKALKSQGEDFEFYPTTEAQIAVVANDIKALDETYDITRYRSGASNVVLDVGAGDGRVVTKLVDTLNEGKDKYNDGKFKAHAIEKASVHINGYYKKDITLIGTDFNETNLISKRATVCFVNPPYSEFSAWMERIITQLNFDLLYAVIPRRWRDDGAIQQAMATRNLKFSDVLAESHFQDGADRKARGQVDVVRFSFRDLSNDAQQKDRIKSEVAWKEHRHSYRPSITGRDGNDPFTHFIQHDLGLKKTHSSTSEKFYESTERQRVHASLESEGSEANQLVKSEGVLKALLASYDRDMEKVFAQYQLIGKLDGNLLAELGVKYDDIVEGVKAKLLGYRCVYWNVLFDKLTTLKERVTSKHRKAMLDTLSANSLDFTYANAIYVVNWAVEMTNEKTEESLVDVFTNLTSEKSILRYYKSNERIFKDDWRYNRYNGDKTDRESKRLLDYRFIHSGYSNFGSNSWEHGLNDSACLFTNDLFVVFRLLGYANLYTTKGYEEMEAGDRLEIKGTHPDGKELTLVAIRYYGNGNKHMKWNQEAMLRFNCTISRILGWVRSKEEFASETDTKPMKDEAVWSIGDKLKIGSAHVLALTNSAHA